VIVDLAGRSGGCGESGALRLKALNHHLKEHSSSNVGVPFFGADFAEIKAHDFAIGLGELLEKIAHFVEVESAGNGSSGGGAKAWLKSIDVKGEVDFGGEGFDDFVCDLIPVLAASFACKDLSVCEDGDLRIGLSKLELGFTEVADSKLNEAIKRELRDDVVEDGGV